MKRAWILLDRLFGVDIRSLAAFRVALGALLLLDLAQRARNLEAHYTEGGILPRDALLRYFALSDWHWSIHLANDTVSGQAVLFTLAAVAAIALAAGYCTCGATVASWLLLVSLQARNPTLLFGADQLLRLLLFWAMFLPLGAAWSVDRSRTEAGAVRQRHLSMASVGILSQVFLMYFFVGLMKEGPAWSSGEALTNAFSAEMFAGPLAGALLAFPRLLEVLTYIVPWFEMVVPFLLFVPIATRSFRIAALVLLVGFHGLMALSVSAGFFPAVSLTALVLFLPSGFWNSPVLGFLASRPGSPEPRHSSHGEGVAASSHRGSGALLRCANVSIQVFLALVLAYVVLWNIVAIDINRPTARRESLDLFREWREAGREGIPVSFRDYSVERRLGLLGAPGRALQLHQRWDMFTHAGPQMRGWPAVLAITDDGSVLSLLEGGRVLPVASDGTVEQAGVPTLDVRWNTYFVFARFSATRSLRALLPPVFEKQWNRDHPDRRVAETRVVFERVSTISGGAEAEPAPNG